MKKKKKKKIRNEKRLKRKILNGDRIYLLVLILTNFLKKSDWVSIFFLLSPSSMDYFRN